jgi:hypothetical protein
MTNLDKLKLGFNAIQFSFHRRFHHQWFYEKLSKDIKGTLQVLLGDIKVIDCMLGFSIRIITAAMFRNEFVVGIFRRVFSIVFASRKRTRLWSGCVFQKEQTQKTTNVLGSHKEQVFQKV